MRPRALQCPFCHNFLGPPVDLTFKDLELTAGICKCGAVYVFDRTGHDLGTAYIDALTFLCRGDIDKALALIPEDYETADFDYDPQTNSSGRTIKTTRKGKLLFARLKT